MPPPASAPAPSPAAGPAGARLSVERLAGSRIREVANAAMGVEGVIALWFGEPDLPTPDFIRQAAVESLARGETFYTPNRGIPELRRALSDYQSRLHGRPIDVDRITVTASGMAGVNLIQQVLTDPGDNVVVTAPVWPNLVETVRLMGGEPRLVGLRFGNAGWRLDLDELFAKVDGRTRALLINSPSNPTGWMLEPAEQRAVLEFARARGLWVVSDEVYVRLAYDRPRAPSFLDLAEPDDRVVAINSFSKSWTMTGWRLGWLTAPPALGPVLEKVIEYHHSCAVHFVQAAGVVAVSEGEALIGGTVERYRRARDLTVGRLQRLPRVQVARPEGAFYAFFRVDGLADSLEACKRIVREARVGLAPGIAFGPEGEGWIRLCFAQSEARLEEALDRLQPYLE